MSGGGEHRNVSHVLSCQNSVEEAEWLTRCRTHLFLGKPDTEENRAAFVSTIPLGRGSTPADVANACCYLASDEAEFITGVNLEVSFPRQLQDIVLMGI